jgi:hypothetical protein
MSSHFSAAPGVASWDRARLVFDCRTTNALLRKSVTPALEKL